MQELIQLIILFFVIFDPPMSFSVFLTETRKMGSIDRKKVASLAVLVAALISLIVLIIGQNLLVLFNTDISDFKIAGGIILLLLGIRMAFGQQIIEKVDKSKNASKAIAVLIGTPLLTGPAAITTIIITRTDYGWLRTGIAVGIVLLIAAFLLFNAEKVRKFLGMTFVQVLSTILGLIIIAWGVNFIRAGFGI